MKVITYTAEWCPWCHKVKDFLKANKVEFEDRDIEKVGGAAEESVEKSGQAGIPVTDIDGDIVIGYDVPTLKKLLKLK
ncbi:MAG: NrdH-redoxin [Candidatus Aenigmarchaeota archaeon]|nr:NrdH-redoxin [Candidatus Aenigmarchaeota archaeon]